MRFNLKTKIWLTVLAIVMMFSFFVFFYFPERQEEYLLRNYNNEVQNLARTVAVGVEIAINEQNFKGIRKEIEIVKDDPRLSFVALVEADTVWNERHNGYKLKDSIHVTYPDSASIPIGNATNDSIIIKRAEMNTKLTPQGSAAILLGFNTTEISQIKNRLRRVSSIASLVVVLIAILVGFWLARNISTPILALREAAHHVGEGDLTQRVRQRSGDEIGDLSKAFNKMVMDLDKAGKALRKANTNLASTNEALNLSMEDLKSAQEQLIQAEKMASLGQLTAGIAHEINNPINFVSANTQPLKDDIAEIIEVLHQYEKVVDQKNLGKEFEEVEKLKKSSRLSEAIQEVKKLLSGMEEGARRTAEIVRGLRNFSRLDQNVFNKVNLNDSLESTLTLLHNSYKNRIEIVKDYADIPEVDCFPGQMNQVLMNILSNAIQAIPGQGKIVVKTQNLSGLVRISVKDNGMGMPEEVRKKIFDPFFTTKEIGKGTGLGLYISYGIIEKHNGKIEVFSSVGEGSEFVITLPVTQTVKT
ncbi:MAG: sensor histidine kinase [Chitinophagales bacterium]